MRFWTVAGAALAALVFNLVFSADADACGRRGRHRQQCGSSCCAPGCGVPFWATCEPVPYTFGCPNPPAGGPWYCYCCTPGWTLQGDCSQCVGNTYVWLHQNNVS